MDIDKINKLFHIDRPIKKLWFYYWNRLKLRLLGVHHGEGIRMYNKVYLQIRGDVSIGSHFAAYSGDNFNPLVSNARLSICVAKGATLKIGDWSGISGGCIWATESITIGSYVNIGANTIIMDGDMHSTDWRQRHNERSSSTPTPFKHRPIVIADDVWIGANCIILKGVSIGARTIIGAGSVVTKDIPADCIAAGNPATVIKSRA